MPNPKRRHSQQRSAKRRTHYKAAVPTWSVDPVTNESHGRHRAHWSEGKLVYRGRVIVDKTPTTPEADTTSPSA